jgi:predicted ester cyclase
MHVDFKDHSLPTHFPEGKEGTLQWIQQTGLSFEHFTQIEEIVSEDNKVMMKIRMELKHIGTWRDIAPTGFSITTIGYRYFKLKEGKILEHWALIDGNSIENQLKSSAHGCKIQK